VGEPFGLFARFAMNDSCCDSEDTYDYVETPLEGRYDVYVHEEFSSHSCEITVLNALDYSYVSPLCSPPLVLLEYYFILPVIIL